MSNSLNHEMLNCEVCVVGGGMAGLCAAIAAARNGAEVVLLHDRPVLGGNASSEVRMWICGAHGPTNKETGILEEIQLDNAYFNPDLNYSIWDQVLWAKAVHQPRLKLLLNTSVCAGDAEAGRLKQVTAWQLTSQTWFKVNADYFVDCSGDSILAPLAGAETRWGREARHEFDEDIAPFQADDKTMGNSILMQVRRTDEPRTFIAPDWATRIDDPDQLDYRVNGVKAQNFWWIEIGGLQNTIRESESIGRDLYRMAWGVWDYLKNRSPEKDEAANWSLEWLGSLPGKRENRRYVGDHVLTQHDVRRGAGHFDDAVAYGGWSMDDHHPAGIFYAGKPTIFHEAPSPYDIPYRSLYSANVENLFCAGRNISATHAALSSTRVMATCALLGQAVGTAAALCVRDGVDPRSLSSGARLQELQQTLMADDVWLPERPRPIAELAQRSTLTGHADDLHRLTDGIDRDLPGEAHGCQMPLGSPVTFEWSAAETVGGLRVVFDSNLAKDKRMPYSYPQPAVKSRVPNTLVKAFRIESLSDSGDWEVVHRETNNYQRLLEIPLSTRTKSLRLIPESTWGAASAHILACEPMQQILCKRPKIEPGKSLAELRAALPEQDTAPPDSGLENELIYRGAGA